MEETFTILKHKRFSTLLVILLFNINANAGNSAFSVKKNLVVNKGFAIPQTITFNAIAAKAYTDADFDPEATASSNLPVSYRSSNTAIATIIGNKVHIVTSGTVTITAEQAGDETYDRADRVSRTFTISKSDLIITASSQTRFYGYNNVTLTATYSGFKTGESQANLTRRPTITSTANARSAVGIYSTTAAGASSNNYNFIYVNGTVTVIKSPLTIKTVDKSRKYGTANPVFTLTYTGFKNGENVNALITAPTVGTIATRASQVGTYDITITGATSNNYAITIIPAKLRITAVPLKITPNNQTKVYGTANPEFTSTYVGLVNGDTEENLVVKPVYASAAANAKVGKYAITAARASSPNYTITYGRGTLTISKATLVIKANDMIRIYGSITPAFTATYTGFVNGESSSSLSRQPKLTAPVTVKSAVGTYVITPSGATAVNYNLIYQTGTLTITKRYLVLIAANKVKTYGAANPALTVIYSGLVNNDKAPGILTGTPVLTTTATKSSDRGVYPIEISGNVTAVNYNITFANGRLTIGKAVLKITVANKTKVYGQPNPVFTFAYSGFVNGENVSVLTSRPTTPVTDATSASPAGTYAITTSGAAAEDYDITYIAGKLTITKAVLTVTMQNTTKVYGMPTPQSLYTITGFVNGDTRETAITTLPISTTTGNSVGVFPITSNGGVAANYTFTTKNALLTITKANLTIAADDKTKAYGTANPEFTATYTGLVNGDTPASLTQPTYTTTAATTSSVNAYPITVADVTSPNYDIAFTAGTLTIVKAKLIVRAADASKNYASTNPQFTVTYEGFVNGDTQNSLITQGIATTSVNTASNAGTYPIVPLGVTDESYDPEYVNGTFTVNKINLTVTANNTSRNYGEVNPAFNVFISGFVNDETEAVLTVKPTATTTATINSPVGNYDIVPTGGVANNYNFIYNKGTLFIGKAVLIITAKPATRAYGATDPVFEADYSGFINGDSEANMTTKPLFNTTANATSGIGRYVITPYGAVNNNYIIAYNNGALTITKATLNVIADSKTKVYGAVNPAFTVSYSGFVNNETSAVLTSPATASSSVITASGAGSYIIDVAGGSAVNYNLVYNSGTINVTKAPLTITANNATRLFAATNPAFSVVYSGFVNGDTQNSLTTGPVVSTTATSTSSVGTYPIIPGAAVSPNYDFTYVNGVLTITPNTAILNFALLPAKTFGNADFDPTATNTVGEPMVYTSSNTAVVTIVNGKIHIVGAGTTTITAAFTPSSNYSQTQPVSQLFVVSKAQQTINFSAIPVITKGESVNITTPSASSGLPVSLSIADANIVSVSGTTVKGLQIGNTTLSAYQPGSENYLPATSVIQPVEVENTAGKVEIQVHQAVSPNGDGINDVFFIEGIKNHPDNQVTIINRNGVKVYEVKGYDNVNHVFDGRSNINNSLLQPGTYFYLIQYVANGQGRHLTGYFVLKY